MISRVCCLIIAFDNNKKYKENLFVLVKGESWVTGKLGTLT